MSAIEKLEDHAEPMRLSISTAEHFDYRSIPVFKNLCKDKLDIDVEVVIDMTLTRYVDSSGMALLHCLQQWVRAPRVTVRLVNCNSQLRQILSRSRLSHHLLID